MTPARRLKSFWIFIKKPAVRTCLNSIKCSVSCLMQRLSARNAVRITSFSWLRMMSVCITFIVWFRNHIRISSVADQEYRARSWIIWERVLLSEPLAKRAKFFNSSRRNTSPTRAISMQHSPPFVPGPPSNWHVITITSRFSRSEITALCWQRKTAVSRMKMIWWISIVLSWKWVRQPQSR